MYSVAYLTFLKKGTRKFANYNSSNTVYIIFLIIGIFGYFTIPTVANWIIMAGGVSHANRAMNQTATKVGNVAAAGAGAAVGNIAGKIVK